MFLFARIISTVFRQLTNQPTRFGLDTNMYLYIYICEKPVLTKMFLTSTEGVNMVQVTLFPKLLAIGSRRRRQHRRRHAAEESRVALPSPSFRESNSQCWEKTRGVGMDGTVLEFWHFDKNTYPPTPPYREHATRIRDRIRGRGR